MVVSDAPRDFAVEGPNDPVTCSDGRVCDDHQPCTANVCTESGCSFPPLLDEDGDGFVNASTGLLCATDCDDVNPDVHPGQEKWFSFHSDLAEFDYDCNGVMEPHFPDVAVCTKGASGCTFKEGWLDKVPACGVTAKWVTACAEIAPGTCGVPSSAIAQRTQECR